MPSAEQTKTMIAAFKDDEAALERIAGTELRASSRSLNELGAVASRLQGEIEDALFDETDPMVKVALRDNALQRVRFVNEKAAELTQRLRDLITGIRDLQHDCRLVETHAMTDATE